jgi:DNA-directed RNA polymerase subunit RPC12/RpoP
MRHEIRKSGGAQCPQCGSYELLKVAGHHGELAREIDASLKLEEVPRWRFLKRRWAASIESDFKRSMDELANLTRFDIVG